MVKLEEDYWRKIIKEYEGSGLSQNDFCSRQGISAAQFKYRWRREMENDSKKERAEPRRLMAVPRFEEVAILGADSVASPPIKSSIICIQFPNQVRCEFEMPVSETGLGLLLKQLVAL
jgi:transposase-like protein